MESTELLKINEVAERLTVSRATVYNLIAANRFRTVKIGKARRVPAEALEEYIKSVTR